MPLFCILLQVILFLFYQVSYCSIFLHDIMVVQGIKSWRQFAKSHDGVDETSHNCNNCVMGDMSWDNPKNKLYLLRLK